MGYNLNFYLKRKKKDNEQEFEYLRLFDIRCGFEFANAFTEELEDSIPFLISDKTEYYDLDNDDFIRVADGLRESIKSSTELIKTWSEKAENNTELLSSTVAKLVLGGASQEQINQTVHNFHIEHDYQSSIDGQRELIKENEELLHYVELLQQINNGMTSKYAYVDFCGMCVNIT